MKMYSKDENRTLFPDRRSERSSPAAAPKTAEDFTKDMPSDSAVRSGQLQSQTHGDQMTQLAQVPFGDANRMTPNARMLIVQAASQ